MADVVKAPGAMLPDVVQVLLDALVCTRGIDRLSGIFAGAKLIVQPPDAAGLAMHQDAQPWIGRRIEPAAPLRRGVGCKLDIGDDVVRFVGSAFEREAHGSSHAAAGTVTGGDIARLQRVLALRCLDLHPDVITFLAQPGKAALPPQVDEWRRFHPGDEEVLGIALLQVEHRTMPHQRIVGHLELQDGLAGEEAASSAPPLAELHHQIGCIQGCPDLQGPARQAQRSAAAGDAVVVLEHDATNAGPRQGHRQRESHGTGADDHDGVQRTAAVALRCRNERISRQQIARERREPKRIADAGWVGGAHRIHCQLPLWILISDTKPLIVMKKLPLVSLINI